MLDVTHKKGYKFLYMNLQFYKIYAKNKTSQPIYWYKFCKK